MEFDFFCVGKREDFEAIFRIGFSFKKHVFFSKKGFTPFEKQNYTAFGLIHVEMLTWKDRIEGKTYKLKMIVE